jgi:hypothetical protein
MTDPAAASQAPGLAERLAEVLLAPSGLVAVALAGLGVLILVLRAKPGGEKGGQGAIGLRGEVIDPPLLDTTLIAPARVEGGGRAARGFGLLSVLGFGAAGLAAIAGMVMLAPRLAGPKAPRVAVAEAPAGLGVTVSYEDRYGDDFQVTARRAPLPLLGCEEGLGAHADAYTACGFAAPVRFELIALAREGERLLSPVWAASDKRAFVLEAPGEPAPFTLDGRAEMVAAPGGDLDAYDAVLAFGTATAARDGEAARMRAEARSLALQDFVLAKVRGGAPEDCRSDVSVHAVSLGATRDEAAEAPRPILVGVRIEDRINRGLPMSAGELDALIDEFLNGQGAEILGLTPEAYGPWDLLSSERACDRSPI